MFASRTVMATPPPARPPTAGGPARYLVTAPRPASAPRRDDLKRLGAVENVGRTQIRRRLFDLARRLSVESKHQRSLWRSLPQWRARPRDEAPEEAAVGPPARLSPAPARKPEIGGHEAGSKAPPCWATRSNGDSTASKSAPPIMELERVARCSAAVCVPMTQPCHCRGRVKRVSAGDSREKAHVVPAGAGQRPRNEQFASGTRTMCAPGLVRGVTDNRWTGRHAALLATEALTPERARRSAQRYAATARRPVA